MGVTRQVYVTATPGHDWILKYMGISRQLFLDVGSVANAGASLCHRPQIAVQPIKCLFDQFIPRNVVAGFVDDAALVPFGCP